MVNYILAKHFFVSFRNFNFLIVIFNKIKVVLKYHSCYYFSFFLFTNLKSSFQNHCCVWNPLTFRDELLISCIYKQKHFYHSLLEDIDITNGNT